MVALAVSLTSLAVSVKTCSESDEHRRITLRPVIWAAYSSQLDQAGWMYGNSGMGPALMKSFKVTVDGMPVQGYCEMMEKLGRTQRIGANLSAAYPGGYFSTDKREQYLFVVHNQNYANREEAFQRDKAWLNSNRDRVEFQLCYCSEYGDCWTRSSLREPPSPGPCSDEEPVTFSAELGCRWSE